MTKYVGYLNLGEPLLAHLSKPSFKMLFRWNANFKAEKKKWLCGAEAIFFFTDY